MVVGVVQQMDLHPWRPTEWKTAPKARMAAKASPKTRDREKESRTENKKAANLITKVKEGVVIRKDEKTILVIDPRAKANQTSSAMHVAGTAILHETVGRTSRFLL